MRTAFRRQENIRDDPAPRPHRSFEQRFAEQFGATLAESDIRFDDAELDWDGPRGAEVC